jgi:uncharacterized RDD family membrane protein YckC
MKFAGFWIRVAALLIDSIIYGVFRFALIFVTYAFIVHPTSPKVDPFNTNVLIIENIIGLLIVIGYFAGFESSRWQATIGKKLMKIKVVDLNGHRISFGQAIGRYLSKIVSCLTFCIGYMMAGWTEKKQALHDKIAGTLVIYEETNKEISQQ